MAERVAIKEGLFTWPSDNPELIGSRCQQCGETAFPAQPDCRACSSRETHAVGIGNRGTLWTWTIQSFMPKTPYLSDETPESFRPYGVGYVEMPCGVRVEARLHENTPDALEIGMEMELVIEPFRTADNGDQVMIFAFRRATEGAPT